MDIMRVTIQLPDDISAALEEQWDDVPRRSLEAVAVEAYRTGALTDRVQLPAGRTLAGFAPGGVVFVTSRDGGATRIEKLLFK